MVTNDSMMNTASCPRCGARFTIASCSPKDKNGKYPPAPGDWSICLTCMGLLVFDEEMNMRVPTPREEVDMEEHEVLRLYREFLEKFHAGLSPETRGDAAAINAAFNTLLKEMQTKH